MKHDLKIAFKYFYSVLIGNKNFEVRYNDRNYKVGDILQLYEVDSDGRKTGDSCIRKVIYILDDSDYLKEGYVILGLGVI